VIKHRPLENYDDYAYSQGGKARSDAETLRKLLPKAVTSFERTFQDAKHYFNRGPFLCLGARTGAEVLALLRLGFKGSQGIDLHPVTDTVVKGDWHAIPFPDGSFANCFTNSLDHCQDIDKVCAEVRRILQPDGIWFVMASDRWPGKTYEAWLAKGGNEFLYWDDANDVRDAIAERGFKAEASWRSDGRKWGCFILRRQK
jgi:SAM-dependent methyltransferase